MLKINPHDQVSISAGVIKTATIPFGVTPISYHEVAEGISNTVVAVTGDDGQDYFLKFYRRTHKKLSVTHEIALIEALTKAKLPVPPYVFPKAGHLTAYYDGDNRYFTTLTKRIPGVHIHSYSLQLASNLGAIHGAVHRSSPTIDTMANFNPETFYNFSTPEPGTAEYIVDQKARTVVETLRPIWSQLPAGIVPMDIKHDNVLCVGDTISGLIDFADTMHAPFVFCLASALWDILEVNSDISLVAAYARAYKTERPLTDLERKHLQDIVITRGWITLHGYLLTGQRQAAKKQVNMLSNYLDAPALL